MKDAEKLDLGVKTVRWFGLMLEEMVVGAVLVGLSHEEASCI